MLKIKNKIHNQNQTVNLFAFPRDFIKEHSCDRIRVKRQTLQTISLLVLSLSHNKKVNLSTGQNTDNFSIAVIDVSGAGSPTYQDGDILDINQFKDSAQVQ